MLLKVLQQRGVCRIGLLSILVGTFDVNVLLPIHEIVSEITWTLMKSTRASDNENIYCC